MDSRQVTDIFVEKGYLTPEQAEAFIQAAQGDSKAIEDVFIESQLVDESGFEIVLAEAIGAEAHSLSEFTPDASTLSLIPSGLARLHGVFPVGASGNTIFVALADPLNPHPLEDIRFALGREIVQVVSFPPHVRKLIREHYGSEDSNIQEILAQLGGDITVEEGPEEQFNLQAVTAEANAAPVVKYVDLILDKAVSARASDIHFEPFETEFKIRY
ncbi:MAG: pilus assembly protein PilB, partial [Spartobacteria bacterium]